MVACYLAECGCQLMSHTAIEKKALTKKCKKKTQTCRDAFPPKKKSLTAIEIRDERYLLADWFAGGM